MQYLAEEVDRIEISYQEVFDVSPGVNEGMFNQLRAEQDGFLNYDKELTSFDGKYRVEKMDLLKDKSIFFVKIGNPQKLSYVIDQAMTTVKILRNNEGAIEIDNNRVKVENICLWIILERKNKIERLSQLKSIIFHMKLVEWRKVVTDAGYRPQIWLNYVRREDH